MVKYLEEKGDIFDIFMSIPVVSPLKNYTDIDNCIEKFIENEYNDLLITVKKSERNPYFNMIKEVEDKITLFDSSLCDKVNRQNFPEVYDLTTIAYILKSNIIKKMSNSIFNNNFKIIKYEVDKISGIDIDDKVDFQTAEFFHKQKIKKNINFSVLDNILLNNKISIVTGGLGHIGGKIVETLLELNSHVIIIDIENENTKKKIKKINNQFESEVEFYNVDLSKKAEIDLFCNKIKKKYDKIDIIVNCAALVGSNNLKGWAVPFESQSMEAFDACMNVNTKAPILLIQNFIELLKKSDNGKIINISSIYGLVGNDFSIYEGTNINSPIAYSISKSGLNIMTKYLASLYGKHNICFNSIILGGIFRNQDVNFVSKYEKKTPLGRMGNEDDIKGMISFLASNLSSYVTGQNICLDGGITCKF